MSTRKVHIKDFVVNCHVLAHDDDENSDLVLVVSKATGTVYVCAPVYGITQELKGLNISPNGRMWNFIA